MEKVCVKFEVVKIKKELVKIKVNRYVNMYSILLFVRISRIDEEFLYEGVWVWYVKVKFEVVREKKLKFICKWNFGVFGFKKRNV